MAGLDALPDEAVIGLAQAAKLLGLEPKHLDTLAVRHSYGLRSRMPKGQRRFRAGDLKAFVVARERALAGTHITETH